jgi:hypothetical protein
MRSGRFVSKNDPRKNVPDPGSTIPGDFTLDQVLKGFEFSEERVERARRALKSPYAQRRRWDPSQGEWVVDPNAKAIPDPSSTLPRPMAVPPEIRELDSQAPLNTGPVFGFEQDDLGMESNFYRDIQLGLMLGAGTALMLILAWFVLF